MKRIIAILLVALSVLTLASCSKNSNDGYAIIAGDTKLEAAVVYSELVSYKNDFLYNYLGLTEDNPSIWSQDSPSGNGESVGDTITRMAVEDMTQFAWVIEYARDNGAVLGEEDMAKLDEGVKSLKSNFETDEEYIEYLTAMKFTEETIRDYLELTLLYDKGFTMLIGENGLYPVTEQDYDDYYQNNFYTVKHIFINDVSKIGEDEQAVALTEEEKKAQTEKAESIYADLQDGASFDTLYLLSEDSMAETYPEGLTFTQGMIDSAYEEAVKNLKVGEYTMVNGEYGGIYIVLRIELSEADREGYDSYVKSAVHADLQTEIYNDCKDQVTVNNDVINSFKIEEMPILM